MENYEAQATSVIHTVLMNEIYPSVLGVLRFAKELDILKLKEAIVNLRKTIPQIFCRYDLKDNHFYNVSDNVDEILHQLDDNVNPYNISIDFIKKPQLQIFYQPYEEGYQLIFIVSHIFSDGAGLKQIMSLLVKLYNEPEIKIPKNNQNLHAVLNNLPKKVDGTVNSFKNPNINLKLPFPESQLEKYYDIHQSIYPKIKFIEIHQKAKKLGFTINDVLLTAYMRMLAKYNPKAEAIPLSCPTDTRQFLKESEKHELHIGNFTARYSPQPSIKFEETFIVSCKKVSEEMARLKKNHQFLESTLTLINNYENKPLKELRQIADENYHMKEISYTNMSYFKRNDYTFLGNTLIDCFTSGAFRKAPMYQICFSTFEDRLNLVANVIGDKVQHDFAVKYLHETVDQLDKFIKE
ncbi:Siderophore/Surfactin synthetase related protein [Lactococcus lactis subsp. lactis]|uniref:hypothetical protein n=1 Tax=Lactococcus lactis TaxID=1358 RepID=UPI00071CC785|nr:hypothetical protein [Lactococcus lactis]KST90534.1 Siderophore/Surfactin synthetase related protein [Lactococcus lactis subsp. lactis]